MSARKLLIVGNYGAGNLGDDAILAGILTDLKELGFKGEISVTHGGMRTSTDIYRGLKKVPFAPVGLRSRFRKKRTQEVEASWSTNTYAILGGGGLFTDAESWKAAYIWYRQAKTLQKLKIPYLIYGQSIGPLKSPWSRFWAKKSFKGAQAIHLRDHASAVYLKGWNLSEPTLGGDVALSWLLKQKSQTLKRQEVFLLSLRRWPGIKPETWLELAKPLNEWAKKRKLKPVLISMEPFSKSEKTFFEKFSWEVYYPESARDAFIGFQKARVALTMRLHASIFALIGRTPFFALAYSKKVEAFFQSLGLDAQLLKPSEWTEQGLRTALKEVPSPKAINVEALIQANRAFLRQGLGLE